MWKVVQPYEKADFIKDYQNDQYKFDDIIVVDSSGKTLSACKLDKLSVPEFVMDDIIILVETD